MTAGAAQALEEAAYDRLTAVRETRASELERYFSQLRNQVLALSGDEAIISALEQFDRAWPSIPSPSNPAALDSHYQDPEARPWFPADPRTQSLQLEFIAKNPHQQGVRDLLLEAPALGRYGEVHANFHPTLQRYKSALGFYDLFLISADDGRVLYSVMKEIDLGVTLSREPYSKTPLASVFRKSLADPSDVAMEDYSPYVPSALAPAAFLAAPLRRAGNTEGILVAQVAIDEVNDVMDGGRRWREQGLGESGQAYVVGPDRTLRSDLRESIEHPARYLQELRASKKVSSAIIEQIARNRTSVLTYPLNLAVIERVREGAQGAELGTNILGTEVLRSRAPLRIGDLHWTVVAEVEKAEALQPVALLRERVLSIGLIIAVICFLAAGWLGASVTGPILAVASVARRLGKGERGLRIHVPSNDEIGQLAHDFNRMSDDLEHTTVSRDEYQALSGRLISAQEDERGRIARELHDDFTQRLAAAAIEAGRLEKSPTPDTIPAGLTRLKQELAAISDDVHSLSRRLHPAMLDDLGLVASIEAECRASFERGGPPVDVRIEGSFSDIPQPVQLALYRITQEALRNIQRHAGADSAELRLIRRPQSVELEIHDHGQGFDRSAPGWTPGLGLASMQERANLLNGSFAVTSQPGQGTTIRVSLPL